MSPAQKRAFCLYAVTEFTPFWCTLRGRNVKASGGIEPTYSCLERSERDMTSLGNMYFLERSGFLTSFQTNEW